MTKGERLQEAREALLNMKCAECNKCNITPCPINEESGLLCPKEVDQILNLRDSEGNPYFKVRED